MCTLTKETFDWLGFVEEVHPFVSYDANTSFGICPWKIWRLLYKDVNIGWTIHNHLTAKKGTFYEVGAFTAYTETPKTREYINLFENSGKYIGQIVDAMNRGLNDTFHNYVPCDLLPDFGANEKVPHDVLIAAYKRGREIAKKML